MSEVRVSYRYAKSIFDLASEKNLLDRIKQDAELFVSVADENRGFENMLKSPIVHTDKKWAVISKLFGNSFHDMTMSFIKIVLRKKREMLMPDIFKALIEMYNESKGILSATVYTAIPVSEKIKEDIKHFLEKRTNRSVLLDTKIKEDVLGGFVLQYEDKLVDASVASQLRSLRKHLITNN